MMSYDEWYDEYRKLAKERGVDWVCADRDDEMLKDAYNDGDTPWDMLWTDISYYMEK
jgi:hypothetical protein